MLFRGWPYFRPQGSALLSAMFATLHMVRRSILAGLLLLIGVAGSSQVVNIENKRLENDSSAWTAQAGFRFNMVQNTQRSYDLGGYGLLQHIRDMDRFFFVTDFNVNRVEENAFTNTGFQHIRYQRAWKDPVFWEVYTQLQYNQPLRIDLRWATGAGPRVLLFQRDDLRLALGSSIMYEHEVDRVNDIYYNDIRSSNYVSVAFKAEPNLQLTTIVYYQPLIGDASDQRLALEMQLRITVTRRFAFDTRINLQNDTKMAPGIPNMNYLWQNTLSVVL